MMTAPRFDDTCQATCRAGSARVCPAPSALTLSDVFGRLAAALDADAGAAPVARHVMGYAPPKKQRARAARH